MLNPGDSFGRYTIQKVLGQGGMGTVYQALDERLHREVALKLLSHLTGAEAIARALREARAAAAFSHPHGIAIFDVAEQNGTPYIVMELVSGHTLRQSIGKPDISVAQRCIWLGQVADVLSAAHQKGLVHRDIKPENVMLSDEGILKVLDFGIAKSSPSNIDPTASTASPALPTLTKDGVKVGTPLYMAPEQIRGDSSVDARCDQFAWGVLAYELLSGRLPFRGAADPLAVVASILMDPPDFKPLKEAGVSKAVAKVIFKTLEKKPDDRYASMKDAAQALRAALDDKNGETSTDDGPSKPPVKAKLPDPPPAEPSNPPAPSATLSKRYTTDEVRGILALAIERQEQKKETGQRLGFDDLLAAAREVGVDEDVLREAGHILRKQREDADSRAEFSASRALRIRRGKRSFKIHLGAWGIFCIAFLILGFFVEALPWTLIPGLFWGIGVAMHGVVAFTEDGDDAEDEETEQDAWLRGKRRRFKRHLGAWISVNVVFLILGLMTGAFPFTLIPGLFWAIGLGIHGLLTYTATEDQWQDLQERRRQRERKWLRKRGRYKDRPSLYPSLEQEAERLIQTGEKLKKRVEVSVAKETARALSEWEREEELEREAEAEAEAEALNERRRAKRKKDK